MKKLVSEDALLRFAAKDKARLINMIRSGANNLQIMKAFPYMSADTLAAYRAHDTRGTYDE